MYFMVKKDLLYTPSGSPMTLKVRYTLSEKEALGVLTQWHSEKSVHEEVTLRVISEPVKALTGTIFGLSVFPEQDELEEFMEREADILDELRDSLITESDHDTVA
jgi:hypothetical protein